MVQSRDIVVPYDPAWPKLFEDLRDRILPALAGFEPAVRVEHVGSTSVPGLAAKPVIDLDVVVPSEKLMSEVIERLSSLGYGHRGNLGIADREAFEPPADWPYHHPYAVLDDSDAFRDHVDLRDYLRQHPEEAERYGAVKLASAHLLTEDRAAYFAAKDPLIEELLANARRIRS